MNKNIGSTVVALLLAVAYPLMQIVSNNHWAFATNWPDICAAAFAIGYGYFVNNQAKWGASYVNTATTVCGILTGCFLALGPIVATGTITLQAIMMAILASAIGFFTHNPDQESILGEELSKVGVSLPGSKP